MPKDALYFSHDFGARNDPKLQEVQLPLVPFHLCRLLYGQTDILPDMLCAGNFKDMKTACEVRPTVGMGG